MADKRFGTSGAAIPDRLSKSRQDLLAIIQSHIESTGLTLGIDDAVLETLLKKAGVTKSELNRAWPSRQELLDDAFLAMAAKARDDRADTETLLSTWQYLSSRAGDLLSPSGRRQVLVDVIRTAAEYNFGAVTATGAWRSYAGLSATIMSFPETDSRQRTLDALLASEMSFVETMEMFYRNVIPTVGYRLKPHFGGDWQPFVVTAAAVIEGLGLIRASVPALVERPLDIPSGDTLEPWSLASLGFVGVVDAFIEPDPDYDPHEAIARLSGGVDVTPSPAEDSQAY